jgi:hypothetical protein
MTVLQHFISQHNKHQIDRDALVSQYSGDDTSLRSGFGPSNAQQNIHRLLLTVQVDGIVR